ncbi:MAG: ATP-binding cassette domain-containing protein, partial [Deltaproteobacteria bacterium]|nr:ATP-binding cassette domain-containing protein [Deltaproteobacteria bacterium]
MLEVEGIQVYYGDVPVLRNVSLSVNEGEIVTVIGPNGAGKTALLKTIVNLLPLGKNV